MLCANHESILHPCTCHSVIISYAFLSSCGGSCLLLVFAVGTDVCTCHYVIIYFCHFVVPFLC